MTGLNDVVRHVILRITVDQAGLADELATARAKLKALKDTERDTNKDRVKSTDSVTKALQLQNNELDKNRSAHEAASRAASSRGKDAADNVKNETAALRENTGERKRQTVEEAKADAIRQKAGSDAAKAAAELAEQKAKFAAAESARQQLLQDQAKQFSADAIKREQDQAAERAKNFAADRAHAIQLAALEEQLARDEIRRDADAAAARSRADAAGAAARTQKAAESFDRSSTNRAKGEDTQRLLAETYDERRTATTTTAQSQTTIAQETAAAAQSRSAAAASAERAAAAREAAAQETQAATAATRRNRSLRETRALQDQIARAGQESRLIEERIAAAAENRARAAERAARAETQARTRRVGAMGAIGNVLADVAVIAGRGVLTAPRAGVKAAQAYDPRDLQEQERQVTTFTGRVEKAFIQLGKRLDNSKLGSGFLRGLTGPLERVEATSKRVFASAGRDAETGGSRMGRAFRSAEASVTGFFRLIPRGGEEAGRAFSRVSAGLRGFIADLNAPRLGGSGGSLLRDLATNIITAQNKIGSAFQGITRHLVSFQSLVFAVVSALGPLAAILGAVGAAALGLASNLGALVGVLGALPGLLGAALAGFGALYLVLKPVTNVFSAYSAAQKEAAANTNAARDAALAYQEALLQQRQAQLSYQRAVADQPRTLDAVNKARRQATRDIEDYRDALRKLRYDEEGSQLGVENAQLAYRKTLADPTATALDRRNALHQVEGARFDQNDETKTAQRTQQDAADAFKKGVEGSDAVVSAERQMQDAAIAVKEAFIAQQKAALAAQKAQLEMAAGGGTAAAAYRAQIAKLPPETRKVVLAVIGLKDAFGKVRDQLSENIFGPLSGDTGKFADVVKELAAFLTPASTAIGDFAKKALDLFTNPDWKAFFAAQGAESKTIISGLGDALLDTADGFKAIVEQARPFTRYVVDGIKAMARSFADFTGSDRGRKELTWFFENTRKRIGELLPILGNFVSGIYGFFRALNQQGQGGQKDFTTWFNDGLRTASETFKELGQKAQDPNGGFQRWLRNVRPLLHDVVGFLSSAGTFFGKLFSDPRNLAEAGRILREIATKWLPRLAEIFSELSESGAISKIATVLGGAFGFLQTAAGWVDKIGQFFDRLNKSSPIFANVLKDIATTLGIAFGAALVVRLLRIVDILKGVGSLVKGTGNVIGSVQSAGGKRAAVRNFVDRQKDEFFGRDQGTSAARRDVRNEQTGKASTSSTGRAGVSAALGNRPEATTTGSKATKPSLLRRIVGIAATPQPQIDTTNTGGVLPTLYRIEGYAREIAANTRRGGPGGGAGPTTGGGTGPRGTGPTGSTPSGLATDDSDIGPSERRRRRRERLATAFTTSTSKPNDGHFLSPSAFGPTGVLDQPVPASGTRTAAQRETDAEQIRRATNSRTGIADRQTAVLEARKRRLVRESTNLGEAEAAAAQQIGPAQRPGLLARLRRDRLRASQQQFTNNVVIPDDETEATPPTTTRRRRTTTLPDLGAVDAVSDSGLSPAEQAALRRRQAAQRMLTGAPAGPATVARTRREITTRLDPTVEGEIVPSLTARQRALPVRPSVIDGETVPTALPSGRRERTTTISAADEDRAIAAGRGPLAIEPAPPTTPKTRRPSQFGRRKPPGAAVLADVGEDLSVYTGLDEAPETYTKPAPRRNAAGHFTRTGDTGVTQTRNTKGQFGRKTSAVPSRRARFVQGALDLFGQAHGNDAGYLDLGVGTRPRGTTAIADVDGEFDEGYTKGYDDALGQGGNGAQLPDVDRQDDEPKRTRAQRRAERRASRAAGGRRGLFGRRNPVADVGQALEGDVLSAQEYETVRRRRTMAPEVEEPGARPARGGRLSRIFGRGSASAVGSEVEAVAGRGGLLGRLGGGLARGIGGGLVGAALSGAGQLGGDYLANRFVRNTDDRSSISRGLGAVANGAGIGATIGSIIPGVGTVVGGAIGGLAGGAYSLFKDRNLRSFVGDKIGGAARGVGNFVGGIGSSIRDFATGRDAGVGGAAALALGPVGMLLAKTDIGKSIVTSLNRAGSAIGAFFTKTIPDWWNKGVHVITHFFTVTMPSLPGRAFDAFFVGVGRMIRLFTVTLPHAADVVWHAVTNFFLRTLPSLTDKAWGFVVHNLWDPFVAFIRGIPRFFTETIPHWFETAERWKNEHIRKPIIDFIQAIPGFFTKTIPQWFRAAPAFFRQQVIEPLTTFFTGTLPNFFTTVLPNAIRTLPAVIYSHLVQPVLDFFGGLAGHIGDLLKGSWGWVKGLFNRASNDVKQGEQGRMSGGLITGVYQGIEDTVHLRATPDEFVVRRDKVVQPGGKAFLDDYNEGRITPAMFYGGLAASASPRVMSIVPPSASALTGAVPAITQHTVNQAPIMGDVTINNPVRERSEHSLRRQIQIANIRHRR